LTDNIKQNENYELNFKKQYEHIWDKKKSTVNVNKYNRYLIDCIRIAEKSKGMVEANQAAANAALRERTYLYWQRKYESKYTSGYVPYTNEELAASDRHQDNLMEMGYDS